MNYNDMVKNLCIYFYLVLQNYNFIQYEYGMNFFEMVLEFGVEISSIIDIFFNLFVESKCFVIDDVDGVYLYFLLILIDCVWVVVGFVKVGEYFCYYL